jgi:hypothetical protein
VVGWGPVRVGVTTKCRRGGGGGGWCCGWWFLHMLGLGVGVRVVVFAHGRLGDGSEGGGVCTWYS